MRAGQRPLACLALLAASAAAAFAVDPAAFLPATFKNFQRQQPAAREGEWVFDAATPGLAVAVKYTGAVRALPPARVAQIETAGRTLHKPAFAALYAKEIEVVEQGRSYWLPLQKDVLTELSKLLNPGQEFTVYVRYMGKSPDVPERLYLLIDFDAGPPKKLPRDTCFAKQLSGVTVGQPLQAALDGLKSKYGEPRVIRRGQQNLHLFVIDRASETYVVVADAGEGYRERVFSVQLTGRPGARTAFKSLRFGAPDSEVVSVLGKPVATVDSGEGYTKLQLPRSTCSVELKDGFLASILIADDPNYFRE